MPRHGYGDAIKEQENANRDDIGRTPLSQEQDNYNNTGNDGGTQTHGDDVSYIYSDE